MALAEKVAPMRKTEFCVHSDAGIADAEQWGLSRAQGGAWSAGRGATKDEGWELLRRAGFHTLHEGAADSPVP